MEFPKMYNLIRITNEDELAFAIKLGDKLKETLKNSSKKPLKSNTIVNQYSNYV